MLPRPIRLKLWTKIAQTVPVPGPNDQPSTQAAKPTSVSGSPPVFIASDWYPTIITGFQTKNMSKINHLADLLNLSLFYTSGGKINMRWMKEQNWTFSTEQFPSTDLRNLMNFSKLVYYHIFSDSGAPYQRSLTPEQINQKLNILRSSPFLNNLSAVNPTSQLATKIGGNIKTLITDSLLQIA